MGSAGCDDRDCHHASEISLAKEKSAKPENNATHTSVIGGQMQKIKTAIEQLLRDGAPLSVLNQAQMWRRITDQLKSTGVNVHELRISDAFRRKDVSPQPI